MRELLDRIKHIEALLEELRDFLQPKTLQESRDLEKVKQQGPDALLQRKKRRKDAS